MTIDASSEQIPVVKSSTLVSEMPRSDNPQHPDNIAAKLIKNARIREEAKPFGYDILQLIEKKQKLLQTQSSSELLEVEKELSKAMTDTKIQLISCWNRDLRYRTNFVSNFLLPLRQIDRQSILNQYDEYHREDSLDSPYYFRSEREEFEEYLNGNDTRLSPLIHELPPDLFSNLITTHAQEFKERYKRWKGKTDENIAFFLDRAQELAPLLGISVDLIQERLKQTHFKFVDPLIEKNNVAGIYHSVGSISEDDEKKNIFTIIGVDVEDVDWQDRTAVHELVHALLSGTTRYLRVAKTGESIEIGSKKELDEIRFGLRLRGRYTYVPSYDFMAHGFDYGDEHEKLPENTKKTIYISHYWLDEAVTEFITQAILLKDNPDEELLSRIKNKQITENVTYLDEIGLLSHMVERGISLNTIIRAYTENIVENQRSKPQKQTIYWQELNRQIIEKFGLGLRDIQLLGMDYHGDFDAHTAQQWIKQLNPELVQKLMKEKNFKNRRELVDYYFTRGVKGTEELSRELMTISKQEDLQDVQVIS